MSNSRQSSTDSDLFDSCESTTQIKRVGRKLIEDDASIDDPKAYRRLRNRINQRNYRERKNDRIKKLLREIQELTEINSKMKQDFTVEIHRLRLENERLKQEMDFMKQTHPFESFITEGGLKQEPVEQQGEEKILKCAPDNEQCCRKQIMSILYQSIGSHCKIRQIQANVTSYCPEFNVNKLPLTLQNKIKYEPDSIASDTDIHSYIHCINQAYS